MKRLLSAFLALTVIFLAFSLTSCKKNEDAPEGMQLVQGGEKYGYNFWGPEEWIVANHGKIACTYASDVDLTSITFAQTTKPEGTVAEYFESEKTKFPYTITVSVNGESCSFGNADKLATKYVYTYEYNKVDYTCMQIFVENGGSFYIFTYTANHAERMPGTTSYDYYLDKVNKVIENFEFIEKSEDSAEAPSYEKDADGYILVSEKIIAGFNMYVPADYTVDYSSALVSVSREDGTNVTVSETTLAATGDTDYFTKRRQNIELFADKITNENGESVSSFTEIKATYKITVKNADDAVAYEYSYVLEGETYIVYQVLMRKGMIGGHVYVFTYTATPDNYDAHLEEVNAILNKIEF